MCVCVCVILFGAVAEWLQFRTTDYRDRYSASRWFGTDTTTTGFACPFQPAIASVEG